MVPTAIAQSLHCNLTYIVSIVEVKKNTIPAANDRVHFSMAFTDPGEVDHSIPSMNAPLSLVYTTKRPDCNFFLVLIVRPSWSERFIPQTNQDGFALQINFLYRNCLTLPWLMKI